MTSPIDTKSPSRRTLRGLDGLNFLLADVQTGVGPFLAIYLAGYNKWNEERVGLSRDRPLVIFLVCAVMFHFANAAMLPLLGEQLAKGRGRSSMLFMSRRAS